MCTYLNLHTFAKDNIKNTILSMKKIFLTFISTLFLSINANGISINDVRFHNEETDTTRITAILTKAQKTNFQNANERISYIGRTFLGLPYVAHTLECNPEMLTVNIDELDCTTFVETVMAMAYTMGENRASWRDFIHNLELIRYRNGKLNGYSSRLHYISDWIINNSHRGIIKEITGTFPKVSYITKTLDFMTTHRNSYNALSDSVEYGRMKSYEIGYRSHRIPFIKTATLQNKAIRSLLKDGDIIALTTGIKGLDVSHMGIIAIVDGTPHLMHASMKAMKVIIDPLPLHKYLSNSKSLTGIRVIRLQE